MHKLIFAVAPAVFGVVALACAPTSDDPTGEQSSAPVSAAPILMGVDANAQSEFHTATGLTAQVVRVYLKQGDAIPTSTAAAKLDQYYNAGQAVVYSIKVDNTPDNEATNKSKLTSLARSIVAGGHASKTWIALHHEPFPELSGSAFQTMYSTYAPSLRAQGVKCGVIYQTYPVFHGQPNYVQDYTSGILPEVDFIGVDVYPHSAPGGYSTGVLSAISPFTTYAKANGKPFQIDEVAIDSSVSGTQQQAADWLSGLSKLGSSATIVMYYEGSPGLFANLKIENDPAAVTAWKQLYSELTTR